MKVKGKQRVLHILQYAGRADQTHMKKEAVQKEPRNFYLVDRKAYILQ